MARTKHSGKQKEALLDDKEQQTGPMEKNLVKPDRESNASDDDSAKDDDNDNDSEHKEHLFQNADVYGADGEAEATAAKDSHTDSSDSSDAGRKRRTDEASDNESVDSGMSDISSPFFEAISSSDETDLAELRKKNPTYKTMVDERYEICKFKRHTCLLHAHFVGK